MRKISKPDAATLKALLPYGMIGLLATKLGQAYRLATGADIIDRLMNTVVVLGRVMENPLPSLHPFDLLVGMCCGVLLWLTVYYRKKNAKKFRHGAEYGSARWSA